MPWVVDLALGESTGKDLILPYIELCIQLEPDNVIIMLRVIKAAMQGSHR